MLSAPSAPSTWSNSYSRVGADDHVRPGGATSIAFAISARRRDRRISERAIEHRPADDEERAVGRGAAIGRATRVLRFGPSTVAAFTTTAGSA